VRPTRCASLLTVSDTPKKGILWEDQGKHREEACSRGGDGIGLALSRGFNERREKKENLNLGGKCSEEEIHDRCQKEWVCLCKQRAHWA